MGFCSILKCEPAIYGLANLLFDEPICKNATAATLGKPGSTCSIGKDAILNGVTIAVGATLTVAAN
jgi:hypothetical protein